MCVYMYSNIQMYKYVYAYIYICPVKNTVKDYQFRMYQRLQEFAGIAEGLLKLHPSTFASAFTIVLQSFLEFLKIMKVNT